MTRKFTENIERIRRFLRDPDSNIWDNTFLKNLWNDEQNYFARSVTPDEVVTILRHPPLYQCAYLYPWEWYNCTPSDGYVFQALFYHRQWQGACLYDWEAQATGINSASETAFGTQYTQPWEAFCGITPARLPPNWLPRECQNIQFLAYDKEPLDFIPWKELQSQDRTFETYTGEPRQYTIKDNVSQEVYLYPRPGAVWDDIDGEGVFLDADWASSDSETGFAIDSTGAETEANTGIALDNLRIEDNILLIYRQQVVDIVNYNDESKVAPFFQKYIEYGVIARSYEANTDGRIKSLASYWDWRKRLGQEVIKKFKWNRLQDRNFQLAQQSKLKTKKVLPRLPSTYPAI